MTIEMEENKLTLRALNDGKSAFAAVSFGDSFFDQCTLTNNDPFSCKIPVKVRM